MRSRLERERARDSAVRNHDPPRAMRPSSPVPGCFSFKSLFSAPTRPAALDEKRPAPSSTPQETPAAHAGDLYGCCCTGSIPLPANRDGEPPAYKPGFQAQPASTVRPSSAFPDEDLAR